VRWEHGGLVGGSVKRKAEWTGQFYSCFYAVTLPILLILFLIWLAMKIFG
jgi:hypothetical protein